MGLLRRKNRAEPAPAGGTVASEHDEDDLDAVTAPLADRLRRLEWPSPPDDVRDRCLREILARIGTEGPQDDGDPGPARAD